MMKNIEKGVHKDDMRFGKARSFHSSLINVLVPNVANLHSTYYFCSTFHTARVSSHRDGDEIISYVIFTWFDLKINLKNKDLSWMLEKMDINSEYW